MLRSKAVYLKVRRIIDIIISFIVLIISSPIFLIIIIAIKIDSKGPVLFKQKRFGKGKTYFNIYKFRTMRVEAPRDMPTHLLENPGKYITRIGKLLRKTSLDELPQIWNIFIGQMSIIGPRPALWNQLDLIAERDKYSANDLTPGLTGWAQINGRDELPINIKAILDGEYVQRIGLEIDIKCFIRTILRVIKCDGVVEGSNGTKSKRTTVMEKETK
jgi:O-antigen biosynthesis protein WbqP